MFQENHEIDFFIYISCIASISFPGTLYCLVLSNCLKQCFRFWKRLRRSDSLKKTCFTHLISDMLFRSSLPSFSLLFPFLQIYYILLIHYSYSLNQARSFFSLSMKFVFQLVIQGLFVELIECSLQLT